MEQKPFADIFEDVTKQAVKIQKKDYLPTGRYPIIDQGQEWCAGYTDREDGLFQDVPAYIFGDHTRIIKYTDEPFYLGADGVKLLKLREGIQANPRFFYYALKSQRIHDKGYNRHFKWLKESLYHVPTLNEQTHIANTLDTLSTLITLCETKIFLFDELVKSRFIELFGDPVTNPMGWDIQKLSDLSHKISDGVHAKPNYTQSGKPFISVVNINKGILDFKECKYVSEEDYLKMIKSTRPEKGDVLYTKVGATYGIPTYVATDKDFCLYVSVCLIKPMHEVIDAEFLTESMRLPYVKHQADRRIRGIGVPDLHLNQIREFQILTPPLNRQKEWLYNKCCGDTNYIFTAFIFLPEKR